MASPDSSKFPSPAHKRFRPLREAGRRIQRYDVQPSEQLHLFHGLPFQKYALSLLQSEDMQSLIVSSEFRLLLDKTRVLRTRLLEGIDPALFEVIEESLQENYNALLEETVGLLVEIASLIAKLVGPVSDSILPPQSLPVDSEPEAFKRNIAELGKLCEVMKKLAQAHTKLLQRRVEIRFETNAMNLFLEYVARARFNIAELSEEFASQETHRKQQMKLLSHMASMSTLQHLLPPLLRPYLKHSHSPSPTELQQQVLAVTRSGTIQRNMGLAVLHSLNSQHKTPADTSEKAKFIDRMLGKFTTHRRGTSVGEIPASLPATRRANDGSPELSHAGFYRNFSHLYLSNDIDKLARRKVARPSNRFRSQGKREVLNALKVGLRVSPEDKRFAIRELMEEHGKVIHD